MKVLKKLQDYILVRVSDKIPVHNACEDERSMRTLIDVLEQEFIAKVKELKQQFLEECEQKYPELKTLVKDTGPCTNLYNVYGSDFAKTVQALERKSYMVRRKVCERISLILELSQKDLSLDEIDEIITEEIFKALDNTDSTESENICNENN